MQEQVGQKYNLEMMKLPVIVVHRGAHKYLDICIRYAMAHGHKVVLIGDKTNKGFITSGNIWIDSETLLSERMSEFDRSYRHMNTNPYEYERFCFDRHFLVYEYIQRKKIDRFIMIDSDILLGEVNDRERELLQKLESCDAGLCCLENQGEMDWSASPHFSYWTRETLGDFTEYCLNTYQSDIGALQKKQDWQRENGIPGGICDMTLLYLWSHSNHRKIFNFCAKENLKYGIDHQLISKKNERYTTQDGMEQIIFKNGTPYFTEKESGEQIRAFVIHAQGTAKRYMKMLSEGKNSRIEKKMADLKAFLQRKLRICNG